MMVCITFRITDGADNISAQRFGAYTPALKWAFPHSSPRGQAAVIGLYRIRRRQMWCPL
jgi:hypothetical protein